MLEELTALLQIPQLDLKGPTSKGRGGRGGQGQEGGKGFFITRVFKHSWTPKRSWKISHGGPGKVLDIFVSKKAGTLKKVQVQFS